MQKYCKDINEVYYKFCRIWNSFFSEVNSLTFTSGLYAGQRSVKKQSDDRLLAPFAQVRDKSKTNQQIIELEI